MTVLLAETVQVQDSVVTDVRVLIHHGVTYRRTGGALVSDDLETTPHTAWAGMSKPLLRLIELAYS